MNAKREEELVAQFPDPQRVTQTTPRRDVSHSSKKITRPGQGIELKVTLRTPTMSNQRWTAWERMLTRPTAFGNETGRLPNGVFEPSKAVWEGLQSAKVLVIGAGGLGCEILKNLALSGVTDIHCIDLDTIDISNLNRQFLFRMKDVGRGKAEVAAEFVMRRVPGCKVTPYMGKIQDFTPDFYQQFKIIVCGLDNIEARRWLNSMIVGLVKYDAEGEIDVDSIIPIIDGGTEGFKGQARVIIPKVTACFECTVDTFPPQVTYQLCTIAETPRIPEHCIAYAYTIMWEREFPDRELNKDSPDDMQWIYEKALERAKLYGIEGVTYFKTLGVVKNVIAAVASTNAIISAACTNECIKMMTFCGQTINNYFMYMGGDGVFSPTFTYERKDDCLVCSDALKPVDMTFSSTLTLRELISTLAADPNLQLKRPSLAGEETTLYMQNPPSMEAATRKNLDKALGELLRDGEYVTVNDPVLSLVDKHLTIRVHLKEP